MDSKAADAEAKFLSVFDSVHFLDAEISRNILLRAREIRDYYYRQGDPSNGVAHKMMDAADAIHLATALIYEVSEFHTRDDDRKGSKVPLVSLYEWSGETEICGRYPLKIASPEAAQAGFNFTGKPHGQDAEQAE